MITPYMLKQVDIERLMNYAMDKGWHEEPFERDEVMLLTRPGGAVYDILIPAREFLIDNNDLIMRAMETIAAFDNTDVDSVYRKIVSTSVVKKIIVDCCRHCPNIAYYGDGDGLSRGHYLYCGASKTHEKVEDVDSIPGWCELEDN